MEITRRGHDVNVADISSVGVVPDLELTNRHLVDDELWERLVNRIVEDEGIERHLAERIMDQALAFLSLVKYEPEGKFSPSELVDIGWHTFILYTKPYSDFCVGLTGHFIHHNPSDVPGVDYTGGGGSDATVVALKRHGIVVDEPLWAHFHEGDCTSSDGGGDQGCRCGPCNY